MKQTDRFGLLSFELLLELVNRESDEKSNQKEKEEEESDGCPSIATALRRRRRSTAGSLEEKGEKTSWS